eukprot:14030601-Heterocapsa_arctica.AAC.1
MEGNREADKLAIQGVEMHAMPLRPVEQLQAQEKLVKDLLTMMLSVMKGSTIRRRPGRRKRG